MASIFRLFAALFIPVTLVGCALSPSDIVSEGRRYTFVTSAPIEALPGCIQGKLSDAYPGLTVTARQLDAPHSVRVVMHGGESGAFSVIDIRPAANGGAVDLFITPRVISPDSVRQRISEGFRGCGVAAT